MATTGQAGVDRPAQPRWIPVRAFLRDHAMALAGVPASTFYWDAKVFAKTCADVAAYYGFDEFSRHADVYNFEIEAMGGKMVYSDKAMPTIDFRDPLIKLPEDLRRLRTPDFYTDGRLPFALECLKLSGTKTGSFCSIFSMAVGMRTYPALIKDMRKRPEFVHALFTFISDQVLAPYLKVQKEHCGISSAVGADAWSSVPELSIPEMNQWLLPYYLRLMEKGHELGIEVMPGGGGYCEEDPSKFDAALLQRAFDFQMITRDRRSVTLSAGNWRDHALEVVGDYAARRRALGTEISIMGGVEARLLRDGPVDKIVNAIKRQIDILGRDNRMEIWLMNIPADTPSDHVHAAVAAIHTYGRLPVSGNLDTIDFKPPQRGAFSAWRRSRTESAAAS